MDKFKMELNLGKIMFAILICVSFVIEDCCSVGMGSKKRLLLHVNHTFPIHVNIYARFQIC